MNILDENLPKNQRQLLERWRIRIRQIGFNLGRREDQRHPIPEASPTDMLQFFMEDRQLSQRAVALGSGIAVSTMSELLTGRRQMNLEHMRKLAAFFHVSVSLFLPDTKKPHSRDLTTEEFAKAKKSRRLNERFAKR